MSQEKFDILYKIGNTQVDESQYPIIFFFFLDLKLIY